MRASLLCQLIIATIAAYLMTDVVESSRLDLPAVTSLHNQLRGWLRDHALPLWDAHGVDRRCGGFFETLAFGPGGSVSMTGSVRRGRVVARQIYAFDVGHSIGWRSHFANPVDHGSQYLLEHLRREDGIFHTAVHAETRHPVEAFSLYEHAFYLFALARLCRSAAAGGPFRDMAVQCLDQLRSRWGRADGGFEESYPSSLPLKSNPHMHLLEAALAWVRISDGTAGRPWIALAREIVALCLSRFVDPDSGAVREYFDEDWRPAPGDQGRSIEPGHQFEWAWLLLEWASIARADATYRRCADAALGLMEVGEHFGVDPVCNVAVNELWMDMSVKDPDAKLWPQTERLKAWCARLASAATPAESELACGKVISAGRSLWQYLRCEPAGLWHEVRTADGSFAPGPCKASSFYHIVCAIDVMLQTVPAPAA